MRVRWPPSLSEICLNFVRGLCGGPTSVVWTQYCVVTLVNGLASVNNGLASVNVSACVGKGFRVPRYHARHICRGASARREMFAPPRVARKHVSLMVDAPK
jgi:hypothetical protein